MHIQQLSVRLEGTVKKASYDELFEKYQEAKQLKIFAERKAKLSDQYVDSRNKELTRLFGAKEEELVSEISALKQKIGKRDEVNAKLVAEMRRLTRKLSAYANPNSDKVPREELVIAEERQREMELELKSLTDRCEALVTANEEMKAKLSRQADKATDPEQRNTEFQCDKSEEAGTLQELDPKQEIHSSNVVGSDGDARMASTNDISLADFEGSCQPDNDTAKEAYTVPTSDSHDGSSAENQPSLSDNEVPVQGAGLEMPTESSHEEESQLTKDLPQSESGEEEDTYADNKDVSQETR